MLEINIKSEKTDEVTHKTSASYSVDATIHDVLTALLSSYSAIEQQALSIAEPRIKKRTGTNKGKNRMRMLVEEEFKRITIAELISASKKRQLSNQK